MNKYVFTYIVSYLLLSDLQQLRIELCIIPREKYRRADVWAL